MPTAFSRTTRALDADRAGLSRWMMGLGVALLAAWTLWFAFARVTLYEISRSARLEVSNPARVIAASAGGRLLALHVVPGQQVHAGDVIAEFDAEPLRLRLAEATARLAAYPARITALDAELRAARQAGAAGGRAAQAALAAARARGLSAADDARFRKGLALRQAGDAADGGLAAADAERSASEARQKEADSAAAGSETARARADGAMRIAERAGDAAGLEARLADLRADALAARAEVAGLRLALDRQLVHAPADGAIGDVSSWRPGEVLGAGARLATLVPAGELQVIAAFDPATALGRLMAGQSARMRLDGRDWAEFGDLAGAVARVGAEPGDQTLRVELKLTPAVARRRVLHHGMTGAVEVAVERVSPATLVLRAIGRSLS